MPDKPDPTARDPHDEIGPHVCVGCCSQSRIWHDFGNRSYVSGLLIGSRAGALMGLRTSLGLISGKVYDKSMGRQTLWAYLLCSTLSSLSRTPWWPWKASDRFHGRVSWRVEPSSRRKPGSS